MQLRTSPFSYTVQFEFLLNGEAKASVSAFLSQERELEEYKTVPNDPTIALGVVLCSEARSA